MPFLTFSHYLSQLFLFLFYLLSSVSTSLSLLSLALSLWLDSKYLFLSVDNFSRLLICIFFFLKTFYLSPLLSHLNTSLPSQTLTWMHIHTLTLTYTCTHARIHSHTLTHAIFLSLSLSLVCFLFLFLFLILFLFLFLFYHQSQSHKLPSLSINPFITNSFLLSISSVSCLHQFHAITWVKLWFLKSFNI